MEKRDCFLSMLKKFPDWVWLKMITTIPYCCYWTEKWRKKRQRQMLTIIISQETLTLNCNRFHSTKYMTTSWRMALPVRDSCLSLCQQFKPNQSKKKENLFILWIVTVSFQLTLNFSIFHFSYFIPLPQSQRDCCLAKEAAIAITTQ